MAKSYEPIPVSRPPVEKSQDDILTNKQVLRRLNNPFSLKKFSELVAKGAIPEIKLGHRTRRYRESAVRAALIKLESEVAA
jgi:hypothetical protein